MCINYTKTDIFNLIFPHSGVLCLLQRNGNNRNSYFHFCINNYLRPPTQPFFNIYKTNTCKTPHQRTRRINLSFCGNCFNTLDRRGIYFTRLLFSTSSLSFVSHHGTHKTLFFSLSCHFSQGKGSPLVAD